MIRKKKTCLRSFNWNLNLDEMYKDWDVLSKAIIVIFSRFQNAISVHVYGIYLLSGVSLVPQHDVLFKNLIENESLLSILNTSLHLFWNQDAWHVLNCLLLIQFIRKGLIDDLMIIY